ncbi:flavodoxin-dependent (E)-4-hydroxy-3-methylbut-2-enyl-diphosphate synthase [Candidatus Solincola sp.]|nr:flavodoxin-dependent (E)-4-hydroxy-3-methylbut-2-enyl-diphosphate synthase [Actinomycetota bacterium]MDI7250929.1 flavodoxin-dependent (E)-4-hydroxy-3-methylbut-2-enyl-diphosphate synthase [Actinomycetota bacterium]
MRKLTRRVMIGDVPVGGGAPVTVQSMTNTPTEDAEATLGQIFRLHEAGCQIVRVAVPALKGERRDLLRESLRMITERSPIPVIADVHFDHRLALLALEAGVHGLRINPGNIGGEEKVREVARAAGRKGVPIRVGVNAGSLPRDILARHGHPTPEALVESALREIAVLERHGFYDIKVSVKASSVPLTIAAYRMLSKAVDYPLHLGVSEAGPPWSGTIRSAVGIGALLAEGIGDTIRVSLAGDPVEEVRVGLAILKALELSRRGPDIVACPTCARCRIDVAGIAGELERRLQDMRASLRIAVMGCSVNGPGEAREADLGIAGGRDRGLLFRKGEPVGWYPKEELLEVLLQEARRMEREMEKETRRVSLEDGQEGKDEEPGEDRA